MKLRKRPTARIKRVLQESRVNAGQPSALWEALLELLQEHHEDERPGIVVSAVAVLVVGKRIDSVLQHSGVIRQAYEMIQSPHGQGGLLVQSGRLNAFRGLGRVLVTRAFKAPHVIMRHMRPNHLSPQQVGGFAHGVAQSSRYEAAHKPLGRSPGRQRREQALRAHPPAIPPHASRVWK